MQDKELDNMLASYFSKRVEVPQRGAECPPVDELAKYASGGLDAERLYRIGSHVKNCKFCSELVEGALLYSAYEKNINVGAVPHKIKEKAKTLDPLYKTKGRKTMQYLKRHGWLILSLASLAVSFFVPRFFLQFMILAVIFGMKWVFNRESTRALIMIYNAWKKHGKAGERELEEIFKNRL